jgi:hypothetical protein
LIPVINSCAHSAQFLRVKPVAVREFPLMPSLRPSKFDRRAAQKLRHAQNLRSQFGGHDFGAIIAIHLKSPDLSVVT